MQQKYVTPATIDGKDAFFAGKIKDFQRNPNFGKNVSLLLTLIAKGPFLWAKLQNIKENPNSGKNIAKMLFLRGEMFNIKEIPSAEKMRHSIHY